MNGELELLIEASERRSLFLEQGDKCHVDVHRNQSVYLIPDSDSRILHTLCCPGDRLLLSNCFLWE